MTPLTDACGRGGGVQYADGEETSSEARTDGETSDGDGDAFWAGLRASLYTALALAQEKAP